jgi:hypothetical protein
VQVGAERATNQDTAYGLWTADVDGPNAGQTAAVSGARRRVDERSDVFVEDVVARDIDSLRAGRAIGLSVTPVSALNVTLRYERGVQLPFTGAPALLRDSGSGRVSWLVSGVRLSALAEVRHERGDALAETGVDRWQTVAGGMVDARPWRWLTLGARLLASQTRNNGAEEAHSIEGYAAAALRLEPLVVLVSYSLIDRTALPDQATPSGALFEHIVSVRPSVLLWDRLRLGAGLCAGIFREGEAANVLAASLRPAFRIVGGLEVAAEVARRSNAPAGESLDALRAEVAYWFDGLLGVAVGYNLHGFSGTGVEPQSGTSDRIYLRLEAAY